MKTFEETKFLCGLTGRQISTVLFCLEGYVAGLDDLVTQNENDKNLITELDPIFKNSNQKQIIGMEIGRRLIELLTESSL